MIVLSKSQLDRYERGDVLPPLAYADHLDALYQGQGWVGMSIRTLWRPRWNPWRLDHGVAGRYHAGRWPAEYGGLVWIKLMPLPENADRPHELDVEWGPWGRHVTCSPPETGMVLVTGKAVDIDGISRVCNLSVEPELFTLYGAGEDIQHETMLDIRRGWQKVNEAASAEESGFGPLRED